MNLDISDAANPKLIGKLNFSPPFNAAGAPSLHSILPLWDRNVLYVNSEAIAERCNEVLNFANLIDNRNSGAAAADLAISAANSAEGRPMQKFLREGHGRYVIFQMAEVAIARQMFQEILRLIRGATAAATPALA